MIDIGSGLNCNRKKWNDILFSDNIKVVMIAHKDSFAIRSDRKSHKNISKTDKVRKLEKKVKRATLAVWKIRKYKKEKR